MMFAQDSILVGDVDCSGEITSQDAVLIMQWLTSTLDQDDDGVIDEDQSVIQTVLPCPENITGLTPDQLQEMIDMMEDQLNINYSNGGCNSFGDLENINLTWSWSEDPGETPFYEINNDGFLLAKLASGLNGAGGTLVIYNDTTNLGEHFYDLTNTTQGLVNHITVPVKQGQYFRGFSSFSSTGLNTVSFIPFDCDESTTPNNNTGSNNKTLMYTIDGF